MTAARPTRRDEILARVRSAIAGAHDPEVPRDYRFELDERDYPVPEASDPVALFTERVEDYRAEVHRVAADGLGPLIGDVLAAHHVHRVVVPADIDPSWLTTTTCQVITDDPPLSAVELDGIDAVITGSAVAVALTGTIVLDAGSGQGRRAISLIPDLQVCVVRADDIVGSVPQAVRRLDPRRPLTWISGPSATSDIELDRVEGVHGPRTLIVIIVG